MVKNKDNKIQLLSEKIIPEYFCEAIVQVIILNQTEFRCMKHVIEWTFVLSMRCEEQYQAYKGAVQPKVKI